MRILLHDFSGHAFPVQLSRELAGRGHDVLHVSCAGFQVGKGPLTVADDDPTTFRSQELRLPEPFDKYTPSRRLRQEWAYGRQVVAVARRFGPDVFVSANTPLFTQEASFRPVRRSGAALVYWQQDLYAEAMRQHLRSRMGPAGGAAGNLLVGLERRQSLLSDAVVAITEDFAPVLRRWGVPPERVTVLPNWAPVAQLPVRPKRNRWSAARGLDDRPVLLYSGTLGLKHDPQLLLDLAEHVRHRDAVVLVLSAGPVVDDLRRTASRQRLDNLRVEPFQPFTELPEVFGTADVVVALLEEGAARYSVPSKVWAYLCSARPVLASMPPDNQAADVLRRTGAGLVVGPGVGSELLAAADKLLDDAELRRTMGEAGRRYAERTFAIGPIADRFEGVLAAAVARRRGD